MYCSKQLMKNTGYLHIIAIIVAVIGTFKQIDSVKKGEVASIALSLSLMIMLLLWIPNQICVALDSSHGWYSVIGTIIGALSYGILTYYNYKAGKKYKNKYQYQYIRHKHHHHH